MPNSNTLGRVTAELREATEVLPPGSRLPSVRELMARHRAAPATVQRAVATVVREGRAVARPGRGTFVLGTPSPPGASPDFGWQSVTLGPRSPAPEALRDLLAEPDLGTLVLSSGYLDPSLQATSALAAATARAARRPGAWGRVPAEGLGDLRAWFARDAAAGLAARDVIVTSGGQGALSAAFRALAPRGSTILVESPTYWGALAAARAAGAEAVPVPTDEDGVRPDLLAAAFSATRARLFYCQPTWANPHAAVLAPERRAAVLDAARVAGAFIVEDDWARDFALDGPAPPPLAADDEHGHVVMVRSLSKIAAPGLRVGALAARGPARERLASTRMMDDFFVAGPLQHAALELISAPAWARHTRAVLAALRERRAALLRALAAELPEKVPRRVPAGGLHLWLELGEGSDDTAIASEAARVGVIVSPGRPFFATEPTGAFLRLSYSAAAPAELEAGVRAVARLMRQAGNLAVRTGFEP